MEVISKCGSYFSFPSFSFLLERCLNCISWALFCLPSSQIMYLTISKWFLVLNPWLDSLPWVPSDLQEVLWETLLAGKSIKITDRCNFYVLFVINGADELAVDLGEKISARTHRKDIIKENASCKSDKFYNDQQNPK